MAQNTSASASYFVNENYKAKAEIKYQIKLMEIRFNKISACHRDHSIFQSEMSSLCGDLVDKYLDYSKLINVNSKIQCSELPSVDNTLTWQQQCHLISQFKQQLLTAENYHEEIKLHIAIASHYYDLKKVFQISVPSGNRLNNHLNGLKKIFEQSHLDLWLLNVVEVCSQTDVQQHVELSSLFHEWSPQQQQSVLDFFSSSELTHLVNALFFYKLYPDKLFNELIHPEKLVSVRTRLSVLHHFIEVLEQNLYATALQHGLKPQVDYLFHGDELPHGILIDFSELYKELIQSAIKGLQVRPAMQDEDEVTLERIRDLRRAYKFWFNPSRLIDVVMVLQQRLVKGLVTEEHYFLAFHGTMVSFYSKLTTTECLDLYGYFSNHDTKYLLYTLFIINQGCFLDWLPILSPSEKKAITHVFQALKCVMEALREELKVRHISTDAYVYDLAKEHVETGSRNREAIFRVIEIYGTETITTSETMEQLFSEIEVS